VKLRRLGAAARWLLPILLVLLTEILFPELAFARGGGGGHSGGGGGGGGGGHSGGGGGGGYGGGGYGSGGGYSSGGGGFFSFFGGFCFLLVIIAVVVLYLFMKRNTKALATTGAEPFSWTSPTPPASNGLAMLQPIAEGDPGFEAEGFLQKAEMAFLLVQRAYQDRNVHEARAFMSPALWNTWSEQVNYLLEQHQRPILENLNVRGLAISSARTAEDGQSVTVHLDYVAAVHFNDDRDGKLLAGSQEDDRLGEDWTFSRAPETKTVQDGGATASKCPNCGGLLKLNDDGRCDYCGADIQSGRYDWVLTEMEHSSFQGVRTAEGLGLNELDPESGLAAIQADDPAFDIEQFRGRTQQGFYSLQEAWQARDLNSSRPFMSPGLYLGWSSQVQQLLELHKINKLDGLHLDDVVPIKVTHGQAFDDITVRLNATCADYEVDERTGKVLFGSHSPSGFTEFWTFQRGRGVQTTNRSLQDRVCPNCGAPLEINQVGECRYCRAAVTSGRFDWVLSRIEEDDSNV